MLSLRTVASSIKYVIPLHIKSRHLIGLAVKGFLEISSDYGLAWSGLVRRAYAYEALVTSNLQRYKRKEADDGEV